MQPFNCLSKDLPMEGYYFVEASAGTGKTFAIEHLTTRLILNGVLLSEILIVTFTKASTRDLKMRIHQNLTKTLDLLESGDLSNFPEYLLSIRDTKEAILLLENALALMEDMSVYTIHSFCYQMLSTYAFEAKVDFTQNDPDENEITSKLAIEILDTLRSLDDQNLIHPASLKRLMDLHQRDLGKFVKKILSFIQQNPIISDFETFSEIKEKIEFLLKDVSYDTLCEELLYWSEFYRGFCNRSKEVHELFYKQLLALTERDFGPLISASSSFFDLFTAENLKAKYQEENVEHRAPSSYLPKIASLISGLRNQTITFLQIAKLAQKKIKESDIESPDDLLQLMQKSLSIETFQSLVRNNYQALIVDEFQDTDSLQWQIFRSLFYNFAKLFVVVGDPKQSIYSFRGADIQTFLEAKQSFSDRFSLATNYRSNPKMIEVLNQLFHPNFAPGWLSFKSQEDDFYYEQVEAGKKEVLSNQPAVNFYLFEGKQRRVGSWPSQEIEDTLLFPKIANTIVTLYEKDGVDLSRIAILIKDRFQAKRLSTYLDECNIALISNTSSSLIETDSFTFIEAAISATYHPRNLSFIKQVLAHPFIHWPLQKLSEDISSQDIQRIISIFQKLQKILYEGNVPNYFHSLFREKFLDDPLLYTLASNEEAISDFNQIIPLFLEVPFSHLEKKVEEIKYTDLDQMPLLKRKPLKEGAAATLMTSHLSKGLEFDYVLAAGLGYRSKAKHEVLKIASGEHILFDLEKSETIEAMKQLDKEKMRLLYVAMTRAKKSLFVFFPINSLEVMPSYGSASPLELFSARMGKPFLSYEKLYEEIGSLNALDVSESLIQTGAHVEIISETSPTKKMAKTVEENLISPIPFKPSEKKKLFFSFSKIAQSMPHVPLPKDSSIIPAGPAMGNAVHLILEKMIETGIYFGWKEEAILHLIKKDLYGSLLSTWQDEIYDLIKYAFHHPIDSFCLADVPPDTMIGESEFLYQMNASHGDLHFMKGFADLIFSHSGKYYILDWKFNRLQNYNPNALNEAMLEHDYYTQASIYRDALEKHLKLVTNTPFEALFGGMLYVFLRGKEHGWLSFIPKPFKGIAK